MKTQVHEKGHVHALAKWCSPLVIEHGRQVVQYEGDEYLMVGIYFARPQHISPNGNGQRELYYILKPMSRGAPT